MDNKQEDYILISGIQHFVFCKRQWALIHIENQWEENFSTASGRIVHKKAHDATKREKRGAKIVSRGMRVFSNEVGIVGECDVVEFIEDEKGVSLFGETKKYTPYPIEYKKGKPKEHEADIMQLCAQAICLEEMLCCEIFEGAIFYDEIKRRERISFSNEQKLIVKKMLLEMNLLFKQKKTPRVKKSKKCYNCSLQDVCMPGLMSKYDVNEYLQKSLEELE